MTAIERLVREYDDGLLEMQSDTYGGTKAFTVVLDEGIARLAADCIAFVRRAADNELAFMTEVDILAARIKEAGDG